MREVGGSIETLSCKGDLIVTIHCSWSPLILFKEVFLFLRVLAECFLHACCSVWLYKPSEEFRKVRGLSKYVKA